MFRGRRAVIGLAACLTLASLAGAEAAAKLTAPGGHAVWALVIGDNNYDDSIFPRLNGALRDAQDISEVLGNAGLDKDHLKVLTDRAVTGKSVRDAMAALVTNAARDDLVIMTFAGHGAQQPEVVKGSETDGLDELYVLPGFKSSDKDNKDFILDDEVNAFLKKLDDKGVNVIFVADSCFGGGMARLPDPRVGELTFRGGFALTTTHVPPDYQPPAAFLAVSDFKSVVFLSAVNEVSKSPEVIIDDHGTKRPRGALSYAFARALEGNKGELSKAYLTRGDLIQSLRQQVYQASDGKQSIIADPSGPTANLGARLLEVAAAPPDQSSPPPAAVRLMIRNGPADLSGKIDARAAYEIVPSDGAAELVWDASAQEVLSATGDIIAHGIDRAKLAGVIDRFAVVAAVNKLTEAGAQTFVLLPDDKVHHEGDAITFSATGLKGKFPIVFDVNGNGTIDYAFPRFNRPSGRPDDNPQVEDDNYDLELRVRSPFGADFIVALVFDQRQADLETQIATLAKEPPAGEEKKPRAGELLEILSRLAGSPTGLRVGAVSSITDQISAAGAKSR